MFAPVRAEDRTISSNYTLSTDETVDGALTVESGATVDLAGHTLTVKGLAGGGTIAGTGTLYVDTAGGTVANSTVSLTGGLKLTVGGGGTFTASKANQSYTGGTEAEANTTIYLGTATHPLGNGNATQTVTLGAGAKFASGSNYNSTTCAYNFIVDKGASMTFATTGDRSTRRFGSIELLGNASITMQGKSAFVGLSATAPCTFKLNGNTLSVTVNGGSDSNAKHVKSLDAGTIRFVSVDNNGMQNQDGATDFSSARVEFASGAYVHLGNFGMTVGDFMYAGTKWRTFGAGVKVAGRYEAATFHPPIQMLNGSTLDLSGITGALSTTGTTPTNTGHSNHAEAGAITFASGATINVDVGERTVAAGDKLVQFASEPAGIAFVPSQSMTDANLTVVVKQIDGTWHLCAKSTEIPYARWHIDATTPANSGWKFYDVNTNVERTDWQDGVTEEVEVRFFSYAEHQAIAAASVSPFRYTLYGTIQTPGDATEWNLTTCFDGMAAGASIDLNGKKLYLDKVNFEGTITDTSADADNPGELHVTVASGTIANTLVTLTGNLKLVKEGAGTFTASKANQSYTGGTEVLAGTLALGTATHPLGNGNATQTVTVRKNARFDFGSNRNTSTCAYNFVLYGGATVNSTVPSGRNNQRLFGTITLEGDATFTLGGTANFGGVNEATRSRLILNRHTLSLTQGGDGQWGYVNTVDDGKLLFTSGQSGVWLGSVDLSTATFGTAGTGYLNIGSYSFTCGGFEWRSSTKKWTGNTGGSVPVPTVKRRYIAGDFSPPLQMANGAILDLSEVSGTWDNKTGKTWTEFSGYQYQTSTRGLVSFASGATIGVDLSGRTDLWELAGSANPYVVTWASQPNATFTLDAETAKQHYKIEPDATGIKLVRRTGMAIIVR